LLATLAYSGTGACVLAYFGGNKFLPFDYEKCF
jgi:hypothetical protein